ADKYVEQGARVLIPAPLPETTAAGMRAIALRAFRAIDCAGLARVDFFLEQGTERVLVNEINTMPGFTAISMYPKLWEASGLPFGALLDRLIALACDRHAARSRRQLSFTPPVPASSTPPRRGPPRRVGPELAGEPSRGPRLGGLVIFRRRRHAAPREDARNRQDAGHDDARPVRSAEAVREEPARIAPEVARAEERDDDLAVVVGRRPDEAAARRTGVAGLADHRIRLAGEQPVVRMEG